MRSKRRLIRRTVKLVKKWICGVENVQECVLVCVREKTVCVRKLNPAF